VRTRRDSSKNNRRSSEESTGQKTNKLYAGGSHRRGNLKDSLRRAIEDISKGRKTRYYKDFKQSRNREYQTLSERRNNYENPAKRRRLVYGLYGSRRTTVKERRLSRLYRQLRGEKEDGKTEELGSINLPKRRGT
jgi:hypothetical protein